MINRYNTIIVVSLFLVAAFLVADIFFVADRLFPTVRLYLRYFLLSFTGMTALICWRFLAAAGSNDERGKSKVLLKGMAGHFVGSLAVILVYYYAFYDGESVGPVWTALLLYSISLILVTMTALRTGKKQQ